MSAVKLLTSNGGQGDEGLGAWPNWNQRPEPEYSMVVISATSSALLIDCNVCGCKLAHPVTVRAIIGPKTGSINLRM
jgi:hypothetical protein